MTWFRVGGGSGVPASLKSRMNSVLNKKFGTAVDYPPNEWPDDVDLLGLLEEKTASGSIVTFSDGADDVHLKSCEVTIAPTLDGVSSVDVTQTGKNLLKLKDGTYTYAAGNLSVVISNGIASIIGTMGASGGRTTRLSDVFLLKAGDYFISPRGSGFSPYVRIFINKASDNTSLGYNSGSKITIAEDVEVYVGFSFEENGIYNVTDFAPMIEVGTSASTYAPFVQPTTHTVSLGRTIYGGEVDVVKGDGTDENGNDFTFSPVEISSRLGANTMWSDGDMSVTYRSSGTVTPITPTLITKTITANGSYQAADDQADGYSEVVVNVPQPTPAVDPIMSLNAFVSKSGVSGTDTSTVARSFTMSAAGTLIFASGTYGFTNTGSNDGYFEIQKNGVSVVKQYCNTSTNTPISIPEISVEENDVVDLVVGFDNVHSNCSFQFYSAMVVLSEV